MAAASKAIVIFLRYPQAGKVKTRLAASVGAGEALRIYGKLLRRTLGVASDFKKSRPEVDIILFFTPADKRQELADLLPGPWQFAAQQGAHLGERMHKAIEQTLAAGYSRVVLVGTDAVDLQSIDFTDAFRSLEEGCAFLGPATDGGFYLIGLNRPCPAAFAAEQWGGPEVFTRTKGLLTSAGIDVRTGEERKDIDRPEDVAFFHAQPCLAKSLSVIIPTRKPIEQLSSLLKVLEAGLWPDDEIIVSSSAWQSLCGNEQRAERLSQNRSNSLHTSFRRKPESTIFRKSWVPAFARVTQKENFGILAEADDRVRMVCSPQGRGLQMNRGAEEAAGDLYWFLHDDSIPASQFAHHIRKLLINPTKTLGCFLLEFLPSNRALDLIARWANFRTVHLRRPYGDQGLFCTAKAFQRLRGFQKAFLMEDVDFVSRAKRLGGLMVIPEKLFTSPARYLNRGTLRTSLQNHLTMLLYLAGVDEHKLFSYYYKGNDPTAKVHDRFSDSSRPRIDK